MAFRYIQSDLAQRGVSSTDHLTKPANSIAGDLGLYYQDKITIGEKEGLWAFGINISNMGTLISYSKDTDKTPIPTNLRIGSSIECHMNEYHSISLNVDLNRLMVATPPVTTTDTATGDQVVVRGKEPPGSMILGMFQSFYDAPGIVRVDGSYSVVTEELHEIIFSLGAKYRYRKYFTVGAGFRFDIFSLDISYLVPTNGQNSPLSNSFIFTFSTEFVGIIRSLAAQTNFLESLLSSDWHIY